jgi:uncharacterized circularly permuted ATP-grasp superfamily protein
VKQTDARWLWNAYRSKSTKKQEFVAKINTIQVMHMMINLSRVITLTEDTIEGRHVDLRHALYGR